MDGSTLPRDARRLAPPHPRRRLRLRVAAGPDPGLDRLPARRAGDRRRAGDHDRAPGRHADRGPPRLRRAQLADPRRDGDRRDRARGGDRRPDRLGRARRRAPGACSGSCSWSSRRPRSSAGIIRQARRDGSDHPADDGRGALRLPADRQRLRLRLRDHLRDRRRQLLRPAARAATSPTSSTSASSPRRPPATATSPRPTTWGARWRSPRRSPARSTWSPWSR